MRKDDFSEFKAIMSRTALLTYQQKNKDWEDLIVAMFEELVGYEIEIIHAAVREHARREKFFPTIADIIRRIEGSVDDLAMVAWSYVVKAIERFGYYSTVRFPHPAIHYAIDKMGGWLSLCKTLTDENKPFQRRDFIKFFEIGYERAAWSDTEGKCRVPTYLMGFHDVNNWANGHLVGPLKIINALTGEVIQEQLALKDCKQQAKTQKMLTDIAKGMRV